MINQYTMAGESPRSGGAPQVRRLALGKRVHRSWILLAAGMSMLGAGNALAHGYVEGERGDLCRRGINLNCAHVDPADTEHPGTFPQSGAPDGQLGSAGRPPYTVLDQQTSTRWYKHNWSSGLHEFKWNIPAQHISDNFKYYITRPDWNPNALLSRAAFDLTPFCSVNDKGNLPGNPTHSCTIPFRTGYHVILALWQVDFTGATFYSLLDVNFNGGNPDDPPPPPPPPPPPCDAPAWVAATGYNMGATVSHVGSSWVARWYTQGQEPGTTGQYGAWQYVSECGSEPPPPPPPPGSCSAPAWSATAVYNYQNTVSYNATNWRARWYTHGETPGTAQVWENMGPC